ncbi:MAG TPA: MFS transporter, partial [Pseudonocardia sp.]|nr:MFS transporter [Pseudonocardia sp.]
MTAVENAPRDAVRATPRAGGTFASLRLPNYRLYAGGQLVSLAGTWMQR